MLRPKKTPEIFFKHSKLNRSYHSPFFRYLRNLFSICVLLRWVGKNFITLSKKLAYKNTVMPNSNMSFVFFTYRWRFKSITNLKLIFYLLISLNFIFKPNKHALLPNKNNLYKSNFEGANNWLKANRKSNQKLYNIISSSR